MFHCLHCGRIWTPWNPDSPKLKCPTCGKYSFEEVKENCAEYDKDNGSCSGGVSVPGISPSDLPDPGDRKDGEVALLLDGEKDPAVEESGSGSPELEEPITDSDPHATTDPDLPSSGLGGGLWAGLAVLIMGVIAAVWYLYRKRSLAEDVEETIPDRYPDPGDGDLYGRGRMAYRGRSWDLTARKNGRVRRIQIKCLSSRRIESAAVARRRIAHRPWDIKTIPAGAEVWVIDAEGWRYILRGPA